MRVRATTTGADVDDDVDPTAGAILVDAGVYAEGDDEEAAARAIAGVALAQTRGARTGPGSTSGRRFVFGYPRRFGFNSWRSGRWWTR